MDLIEELANSHRYIQEIEKIHANLMQKRALYSLEQDGVPFVQWYLHKKKLAEWLMESLAQQTYRLSPVHKKTLRVNHKMRDLYQLKLSDRIVVGVIAKILGHNARRILSRNVCSYWAGSQIFTPIYALADFAATHRAQYKKPSQRGLYVLRCDIKDYTDQIPLGQHAYVWEILKKVSGITDVNSYYWYLFQEIIRADVINETGTLYKNIYGIPTGSPIAPLLYNLCVHPLDEYLSAIPGAFYRRYSDDLIFVHENPKVVEQVDPEITAILKTLGLQRHPDKEKKLYWTGAGKVCVEYPKYSGATDITYLGLDIHFNGTIKVSNKHTRRFIQDIKQRIQNISESTQGMDVLQRGQIIAQTLNYAFSDQSGIKPNSLRFLLSSTDSGQLKQMDYLIALNIAEILSGYSGVRAFRQISYRKIREEFGLSSLVQLANSLRRTIVS